MKRARILIASLVVAHLLVHAYVVRKVLPPREWAVNGINPPAPPLLSVVTFYVGPSQGTLFALWIALGGKRTVRRVFLAVALIVVYISCFQHVDRYWLTMTIGLTAVLTPILLLARLAGLELTRSIDSRPAPGRFQFSIWDMLVWTTALAVALSAYEYLSGGWRPTPDNIHVAGEEITTPEPTFFELLAIVLFTVPSIWAVLGRRWIIPRILLLPMMIVLSATVLSAAFHEWRYYVFRVIAVGGTSVFLLASLTVVRLAGYRLRWSWRFSRKQLGYVPPDEHAPPESNAVAAGNPVGQAPRGGRLR